MRALELVGFRKEHWGYDYPDCYAEFNDKLKEIAIGQDRPNSILLGGKVGTGKTAMLAILCKSIYEANGVSSPDLFASKVKYCTHEELTTIWEHEFDNYSDLPDIKIYQEAKILFLDDLFAAPVSQSGRSIDKLGAFLDWRWSNGLKTLIATNISLKDLWRPTNNPQSKQYHRIARRLSEEKWIYYQTLTHKFGGKK